MKPTTNNLRLTTYNLRFKIVLLLFIVYCLLFVKLPVLAATIFGQNLDCIDKGDCQLIDFFRVGRIIINGFLGVIGVYALIYSIVGGIMMILSSGKQEKILQGKRMIGFSLIGLIVAFLAWQIVNLVICGVTQGRIQETCTIFGKAWNVFPQ